MYCLTDAQIDYILNDIRRNGIDTEDLQLNLLDHICCIVEQHLEPDGDFEQFYAATVKTFYKKELRELEEETILLLTFKKYYSMKKIMIVSGIFSAITLAIGILLKFAHQPGANVCICLGIFSLGFLFLPLMFTLKMREKRQAKDKVLLALGAICAVCISLAVLFKVQYWPGANTLATISLVSLGLVFLPVYLVTGLRNAETRINTIVSSVLIVAGCSLFLILVRTPRATRLEQERITSAFLRNEQLLHTEQQLAQTNTDTSTAQINTLCEDLKTALLQQTCGYANPAALAADNGLLNDGQPGNAFWQNATVVRELGNLRQTIAVYNSQPAHGTQTIATTATIADPQSAPGMKTAELLTSLAQIQLLALQNQRMAVAVK